jgi:hypothetical protein
MELIDEKFNRSKPPNPLRWWALGLYALTTTSGGRYNFLHPAHPSSSSWITLPEPLLLLRIFSPPAAKLFHLCFVLTA